MAANGITLRWLTPPRLRVTPTENLPLRAFACSSSTAETWRPTSPGINRLVYEITPALGTFRDFAGTTSISVTTQQPVTSDRFFYSAYQHTISASDFSVSTSFTVRPVAYTQATGGASRAEGTYTFYADPAGTRQKRRAYIDNSTAGNDTTGQLDNPALPFKTLAGARTRMVAQVSDPANLGGCEFLFKAGQTHLTNVPATTDNPFASTGEWVIFASWGGNKSNTTLSKGTAPINKASTYVRFIGLRIKSNTADSSGVVCSGTAGGCLTDDCDLEGGTRFGSLPQPLNNVGEYWSRNCDWHKAAFGFPLSKTTLELCTNWFEIGEDVLSNQRVAVGCRARDVDPGAPGAHGSLSDQHADAVQWHIAPFPAGHPQAGQPQVRSTDNCLYAYCEYIDLHYQGWFIRLHPDTSTDNSFVNCVLEMRHPVRDYTATTSGRGSLGGLWGAYEATRIWHCNLHMRQLPDNTTGFGSRNFQFRDSQLDLAGVPRRFAQIAASFVGTYFEGFVSGEGTDDGDWALAGNAFGNRISHNHYNFTASGSRKTPDTVGGTATTGDTDVIDTNPASARFLRPLNAASPLVRASFQPMIAWDITGRLRSLTGATVGAYEFEGTAPTPPPSTEPEDCIQRRRGGRSRAQDLKRRGILRWQDSFSPSAAGQPSPQATTLPWFSSRRRRIHRSSSTPGKVAVLS